MTGETTGEVLSHEIQKTSMDDAGESESVVVAMKPPNKMPSLLAWPTEEVVEPRTDAKRNPPQGATSRTQSRNHDVPCDLQRVRQRALKDKVLQAARAVIIVI